MLLEEAKKEVPLAVEQILRYEPLSHQAFAYILRNSSFYARPLPPLTPDVPCVVGVSSETGGSAAGKITLDKWKAACAQVSEQGLAELVQTARPVPREGLSLVADGRVVVLLLACGPQHPDVMELMTLRGMSGLLHWANTAPQPDVTVAEGAGGQR